MELEIKKEGDIGIVKPIEKRLDAFVAFEFKEKLLELIKGGTQDVILDLEKVEFVDSSGLGAMVSALKATSRNGNLVLCNITDEVKSVLELTRLYRIFDIASDLQEAKRTIEAYKRGEKQPK
mgnify:FL=1